MDESSNGAVSGSDSNTLTAKESDDCGASDVTSECARATASIEMGSDNSLSSSQTIGGGGGGASGAASGGGCRDRTVSSSDNSSEDETTSRRHDEQKRQRVRVPTEEFMFPGISASPPRFVSLEQIMKAANAVSNMALAHEIVVNSDFKIEKVEPPKSSLETQVKEVVQRAFWDVFRNQLTEDPPNYAHALILLNEIKEGLISLLLPHHTKLRQEIMDVLDIALIGQMAENEALDFYYYANYVLSVMSKLCAPVRDDQIRDLMKPGDIVPLFKGIFDLLAIMKLDMANFHIQLIRPQLQQHSIAYEKKKFAEYLEIEDDGLEYTRVWINRNADKLIKKEQSEQDNVSPKALSAKILTTSYMELLQWDDYTLFPETLLMDQSRFIELSYRVDFITIIAAVSLVTYSTVGAAITGISEFKEQLKDHLNVLLEGCEKSENLSEMMKNVSAQVEKNVNACLEKHGHPVLGPEKGQLLKGQIEETADKNHRVRCLVKTRILEFVEMCLASLTASPIKIPPGLSSLQAELSHLTGQFLRLTSHNRAVFGDYYADILGATLKSAGIVNSTAPAATSVPSPATAMDTGESGSVDTKTDDKS